MTKKYFGTFSFVLNIFQYICMLNLYELNMSVNHINTFKNSSTFPKHINKHKTYKQSTSISNFLNTFHIRKQNKTYTQNQFQQSHNHKKHSPPNSKTKNPKFPTTPPSMSHPVPGARVSAVPPLSSGQLRHETNHPPTTHCPHPVACEWFIYCGIAG